MTRVLFLLAATIASAALTTSVVGAEHEHAGHFAASAKACSACQLECDACFSHCLGLVAEGKKEHAKTARLCADCAECCKLAATLCARQGPLAGPGCECCAKCCDECAAACEKYPDQKHMVECAKSCRACAKECREMLKHVGK